MTIELNTVKQMDCVIGLAEMSDDCVDCIVTDPPYRIPTRTNSSLIKRGMFNTDLASSGQLFKHNDILLADYIDELYRVLKPNGHCYIFVNNKHLPYFLQTITSSDFHYIKTLIWKKNVPIPNQYYRDNHEYIIFLRKKSSERTKNIHDLSCTSVLEYNVVHRKKHPCEKPVELLKTLITNSSSEHDIVFDPFMGSFSTAVACVETNRSFYGFELDEDYWKLGNERLKK